MMRTDDDWVADPNRSPRAVMGPTSRGTYVPVRCPECGHVTVGRIWQEVEGSDPLLLLCGSFACGFCAHSWSERRVEPTPPEAYRRALLTAEGTWGVRLRDPDRRMRVVKVLRELLKIPLQRATERVGRENGPIHIGTWTECTWLRAQLSIGGVAAYVVPAGEHADPYFVTETDDELDVPF